MRVFSLLHIILFLVSALPFEGPFLPSGAAGSTAAGDAVWRRFTWKGEEFSVLMPSEPSAYLTSITNNSGKQTLERIYSSYSQGSVYLVVSYDGGSIKGTLENFKAHHLYQGELSYERDISVAVYSGKQYKMKFGEVVGTLQICTTKKHGYAIATIQAIDDSPLREYFLSSFSLPAKDDDRKTAAATPPAPLNEASNLLKIDPSQSPFSGKDVTRRCIVVSKPEPSYTNEGRRAGVRGTVVLRVVFSASGEVTDIKTKRTLPYGLTENAIEAARHLKFIPAVKDGRFVSSWVQLEYNFALY